MFTNQFATLVLPEASLLSASGVRALALACAEHFDSLARREQNRVLRLAYRAYASSYREIVPVAPAVSFLALRRGAEEAVPFAYDLTRADAVMAAAVECYAALFRITPQPIELLPQHAATSEALANLVGEIGLCAGVALLFQAIVIFESSGADVIPFPGPRSA